MSRYREPHTPATAHQQTSRSSRIPMFNSTADVRRMISPNWMVKIVHTDGLLTNNIQDAGAGVYCHIFSQYLPLGPHDNNFDGEITAIETALQNIFYRTNIQQKVVMLTDSKAAIEFICNFHLTASASMQNIRSIIKTFYQDPGCRRGGDFSSLLRVQTGPGVHSTSYKMSSEEFPRG